MRKNISILGSTGSIGRNVVSVVRQYPERFRVAGLAAGSNIELLEEQIEYCRPDVVAVADGEMAENLAGRLKHRNVRVAWGKDGVTELAELDNADLVVSAIVGAAGLIPTLAAIRAGKDVALANKETLVTAGELVMREVRRRGVRLFPIDSEHSAIAQAMAAGRREDISRLILTASGGPFRGFPDAELRAVTPEQALAHPNWDMGRKISIDSATLMNKGLEVIEARWLFGMELEKIEVLVHPQSVVHSLVEFIDGSVIAQLGLPDMRVPIAYALSWPERLPLDMPRLDLTASKELTFQEPDLDRFPALALAYRACRAGGSVPAVLNAANEIAVEAFLNGRLRFQEIVEVVAAVIDRLPEQSLDSVDEVLEVDRQARQLTGEFILSRSR